MQKIIPHLWFDTQAKEAAEFYVSAFGKDSKVTRATVLHGTPSGDCDLMSFELWGYKIMAISAGPYFTINPSVSFMINFDPSQDNDAAQHLEELWEKLSEGGEALMPLDTYPFSKKYGWIKDKYGMSWQLILTNPEGEKRPQIIPSLLFVGDVCGKAEEATDFYMSIFKDSKRGAIARYGKGHDPDKEDSLMFTDFTLLNQWFVAMDSAYEHKFSFNEGVSLMVNCDTQEEIDYYWGKLSAQPESEQCGWLKDKYGLSWQITSTAMDKMMELGNEKQIVNVTKAFLKMKKFDIAQLQKAFDEGA